MTSSRFDLYYDPRPPQEVLRSWRDDTSRPGHERPDIVLFDRETKRTFILEVKFRRETDGTPKREDIFEVQGYLNSFGLREACLIYVGVGAQPVSIVASGENRIIEVPLLPGAKSNLKTIEVALAALGLPGVA